MIRYQLSMALVPIPNIFTRVVPKVPLHSLFCLDNNMSDLTTLMITKYYI